MLGLKICIEHNKTLCLLEMVALMSIGMTVDLMLPLLR
jgi:hypothetical protein